MSMMEEVNGQFTAAVEKLNEGAQAAMNGSEQAKTVKTSCENMFDILYQLRKTARSLAVEGLITTIAAARDSNGEAAQILHDTIPGRPSEQNSYLGIALIKSDEAHRSLTDGGHVGSELPLDLGSMGRRVDVIAGHLTALLEELGGMHEEVRALSMRLDTTANRSNMAAESITAYRRQFGPDSN